MSDTLLIEAEAAAKAPHSVRPCRRRPRRWLRRALGCVLLLFGLFVALLWGFQHRLIYIQRPYPPEYRKFLTAGAVELRIPSPEGNLTAFYMPPARHSHLPPESLWVCFHGAGSLATTWFPWKKGLNRDSLGLLFIEYPGYGTCEGRPSRATTAAATEAAFLALAQHLHTTPEVLEKNLNVLGNSIGTAIGLEFATRHPVRRIVLVSPFTSMFDMARRFAGEPLAYLVEDRYDNRAALARLAALPDPPEVHIMSSHDDELVPFWMGRQLATEFRNIATFHPTRGGHNRVLFQHRKQIQALMRHHARDNEIVSSVRDQPTEGE